jgi:hypothetical protein
VPTVQRASDHMTRMDYMNLVMRSGDEQVQVL